MKVCFVVNEIFAWGKYGGFGSLTRTIGSELVKRGIDVCAVVARGKGQKEVEELDGIKVLSFKNPIESSKLYRECDADIYHSEEISIGSYIAMKTMPESKHILTFQDPRDLTTWFIDFKCSSNTAKIIYPLIYSYRTNPFCNKAVKNMDSLFCQAKYIIPKVKKMYNLHSNPNFLPNPVQMPERGLQKADEPAVCFLGRFDGVKRPEIFFNLAKIFPDVKFIAMGKSHDMKYDNYLREKYSSIPNLEMPGILFSKEKEKVLERSWIIINTSAKECLPVSFLEACAYKCAILSCNNPDDFAESFGYYVKKDDFVDGLKILLENDNWRDKAQKGYEYVQETHELNKVIDRHISIYEELLQ